GLPNQAAKPLPALPKACPDGNALQPLHSLGNQIAKAEGAAERKGNEAALSWTQHFPNPRGEEPHRVLQIVLGIKDPFGWAGGAGSTAGDYPADLGLGAKQEIPRSGTQHLRSGEGKGLQVLQRFDMIRILGINPATAFGSGQGLVQS